MLLISFEHETLVFWRKDNINRALLPKKKRKLQVASSQRNRPTDSRLHPEPLVGQLPGSKSTKLIAAYRILTRNFVLRANSVSQEDKLILHENPVQLQQKLRAGLPDSGLQHGGIRTVVRIQHHPRSQSVCPPGGEWPKTEPLEKRHLIL